MNLSARLLPTFAILKHDLGTLASNWLVRIWIFASGLFVFMLLSGQWRSLPDGIMIAWVLSPYLVAPWFLVVIMLGVGPVAGGRTESLADGILSRPVTRYEYLLASWAARVLIVLGAFLIVVVPAILAITLDAPPEPKNTTADMFDAFGLQAVSAAPDVTLYGVVVSLTVVSLVLTLQVSLAFLLGTLLRRQMVAVALLAIGWLFLASVLNQYHLEELSPFSLNRALPTLLKQSWNEPDVAPTEEGQAEFGDVFKQTSGVLGFGMSPEPQSNDKWYSDHFHDVSLVRVLLGYGLPTILSIALATWCFCRRDL